MNELSRRQLAASARRLLILVFPLTFLTEVPRQNRQVSTSLNC